MSTHTDTCRTVILTHTVLQAMDNTRLEEGFIMPHKKTPKHFSDEKVTDLHVSNVPVDVHGGRNAVFRDVFVTLWIRFTVHRVNTGDGNSFMTKGYVTEKTQDDIRRLSEMSK